MWGLQRVLGLWNLRFFCAGKKKEGMLVNWKGRKRVLRVCVVGKFAAGEPELRAIGSVGYEVTPQLEWGANLSLHKQTMRLPEFGLLEWTLEECF